jgi:16S rRNA (guanine527-N7)-methyltransferase
MPPLSVAGQRLAGQVTFLTRPLGIDQLERLDSYLELLLRWNQRIRLVGPRDPETLVDEHLVDSLQVAEGLTRAMSPTRPPSGSLSPDRRSLVDVGSGAGLPGLVISIALPELDVTLCEPSEKRCAFLHEARRVLDLRIEVFEGAVESLAALRPGSFDHAVCRATFEPDLWAQKGADLVRPGGSVWFLLAQRKLDPEGPGTASHYTLPGGKTRTLGRWIVTDSRASRPCFT